jgi:glycosyltransferase involved in cell wall biosynthesis
MTNAKASARRISRDAGLKGIRSARKNGQRTREQHSWRVAIFAPFFPPAVVGGGPAQTLAALVNTLPRSIEAYVIAPDRDLGASSQLPVHANTWENYGPARVYYASTNRPYYLIRAYIQARRLKPDAIYINSFFDFRFAVLPELLSRLRLWRGAHRLVAPRGSFTTGALQKSRTKKRLYIAVYRLLKLHRSVVWHASTEYEANDIRRVWANAEILIREDETSLPERSSRQPDLVAARRTGAFRGLYLSRIEPHKGLLLLLEALAMVTARVDLTVVGHESDSSYAGACRDLTTQLPVNVTVTFKGPVLHADVAATIRQHDALLLPTSGENFGHVIPESLACATPVICSDMTPWSQALQTGGGDVVRPNNPSAWAAVIEEWATLSPTQLTDRRSQAADVYDAWQARDKGLPVLAQLLHMVATP